MTVALDQYHETAQNLIKLIQKPCCKESMARLKNYVAFHLRNSQLQDRREIDIAAYNVKTIYRMGLTFISHDAWQAFKLSWNDLYDELTEELNDENLPFLNWKKDNGTSSQRYMFSMQAKNNPHWERIFEALVHFYLDFKQI